MRLEDYFDFQTPDDIRIKGHRIGIETVLLDYLEGATPEEISCRYRSLTLEEIYATITYYWHRQGEVDAYLKRHLEYCEEAQRRFDENPPPEVLRLLEIKKRMKAEEAAAAR
ncbi:MAG: DUF433 domain-containing protein [Armatimonadetes bacterium]|nr:DUF433 domain-containing protein [Armatimonadota bacterium]